MAAAALNHTQERKAQTSNGGMMLLLGPAFGLLTNVLIFLPFAVILADDLGLWDNYGELRATLNYFMDKGYMEKIMTPEEYAEID